MSKRTVARYGEWESGLSPLRLAESSLRLAEPRLDRSDAYWIEGRAAEGGRNVIVRSRAGGPPHDVLPAPFSARSRAHEYGGGAFVVASGEIWFCNDQDQRIYVQRVDDDGAAGDPVALTAKGPWRYADLALDLGRRRLVCVREDHSKSPEPENTLVSVSLDTGEVRVLARGHDFYASVRLSSDGRRLAFLTWDHPDMPWDATTLWLAELDGRGFDLSPRRIAGGNGESLFQPEFAPTGALWFVSDRSGWWNLHVLDGTAARTVIDERAEYAMPQWQFGMRTYGFLDGQKLLAGSTRDGLWRVELHDLASGRRRPWPGALSALSALAVNAEQAVIIASAPDCPQAVLRWPAGLSAVTTLRSASRFVLEPASISAPEPVDFATGEFQTAHGFLYRPRNAAFEGPRGERPALIVIGHGGPTSATAAGFNLAIQFWTTRGFAVLDVNYRGSTGYGRAYRRALDGAWGVADVEDCVSGARHLADGGVVDAARLIIRGGSAGGFTALAALTFHDVFSAGASYYGIGELEMLAKETHKFESRYLDRLIGPYPEQAARYRERSPIHHVGQLSCPVIFFQGLEDAVVPPNQAQLMHDALKAKGIPVACLMFEGEQHGFRRAETIVRTLEAELAFYGRVLGFTPAGVPPELTIENLP